MEALRLFGGTVVVRRVEENVGRQALLDPLGHLADPGRKVNEIGVQVRPTDETHLRAVAEGRRAHRHLGLLRLCVQHGRIVRPAGKQRPRVQADTFYTAIQQQSVERPLLLALGKERRVSHLDGKATLGEGVEPGRQLAQPIRSETGRHLQPQRRDALTQRLQQIKEVPRVLQLAAQVTLVADIAGQLGAEAERLRHGLRPAREGIGVGAGIESGVAFHGVEHLGVEAQGIGGTQVGGIEGAAPGRLVPGWTSEEIRQ